MAGFWSGLTFAGGSLPASAQLLEQIHVSRDQRLFLGRGPTLELTLPGQGSPHCVVLVGVDKGDWASERGMSTTSSLVVCSDSLFHVLAMPHIERVVRTPQHVDPRHDDDDAIVFE